MRIWWFLQYEGCMHTNEENTACSEWKYTFQRNSKGNQEGKSARGRGVGPLLFPSPTPSTHVGVFCCCCSCCCCCCDILVVVFTRILFYLTVAIVLQLSPKATNAPQPDPSWLNNHLKLRQTRVDSSLWPRGTVPESPSGTKGCKTSICPTLLTT